MRSSHYVLMLQVVNSKRPSLSHCSQDTARTKTNRHLGKVKGGTGGIEDIEIATNDLLQVSSLACVFLAPCVSFSVSSTAISLFPTHSPTNGYLPCWKGLHFLTGGIDNRTQAKAKQPRTKSESAERREEERGRDRRKERKIYHSCRSPR